MRPAGPDRCCQASRAIFQAFSLFTVAKMLVWKQDVYKGASQAQDMVGVMTCHARYHTACGIHRRVSARVSLADGQAELHR